MNLKTHKKFIPDDHDTKSALSTGKVSDSVLASLFLRRGLIVSPDESREVLAANFSSYFHCYREFEVISSQHAKSSHKEFTTAQAIKTNLTTLDINSLAQELKSDIESSSDKSNVKEISITQLQDKVSVRVGYVKHKPEMNLYSQYEHKDAVITFEKNTNGEFYMESPQNPEIARLANSMLTKIKSQDTAASPVSIELTGITDPKYHWMFFDQLTSTLPGYTRKDVVDVYLTKPKRPKPDTDEEEEDEDFLSYRIDKASYRGQNLHDSVEFKAKIAEGFHLFDICWDCVESNNTSSDKFRLKVKFNDPENYSDFAFIAQYFYQYKDGDYLKSSNPISSSDDSKFRKLIYDNARKVLSEIRLLIAQEHAAGVPRR